MAGPSKTRDQTKQVVMWKLSQMRSQRVQCVMPDSTQHEAACACKMAWVHRSHAVQVVTSLPPDSAA